jgi:hypothetical protein
MTPENAELKQQNTVRLPCLLKYPDFLQLDISVTYFLYIAQKSWIQNMKEVPFVILKKGKKK